MIKVTMPQLGESVVEATLENWLVKPGDAVEKYQPICEVITDKVNVEIPSTEAGFIAEILVEAGSTVPVGTEICTIRATQDGATPISATDKTSSETLYSPAVRKLAEEHSLDLSQIKGTGEGGRVTRQDVLGYLKTTATPISQIQKQSKPEESFYTIWQDPEDEIIPVDPVRRTIAQKMVASVTTIPHAWAMVEVDLTDLVAVREQVKDSFYKKEGVKLTYLPFFVQAVVHALQDYPIMNSSYTEENIIIHKDINISLAVATERALYTPVIHQADRLSVPGIAHKIAELANKARTGQLSPAEINKGTFTVNNTGSFGSQSSMPIINPPQVGMITLESIMKRPVVIDDMIAIRSMANICYSFDHRVTDGLTAGRFMHAVCGYLSKQAGEFKKLMQA